MTKIQKEAINEIEMMINGNAQGIMKIICGILNIDYDVEDKSINMNIPHVKSIQTQPEIKLYKDEVKCDMNNMELENASITRIPGETEFDNSDIKPCIRSKKL